MKKRIVIIGAAGFVGLELVDQLQKIDSYELFAITRDNGSFLLGEKKINLVQESELEKLGYVDVVINLAYPTINQPHFYPEINKKILNNIKKISNDNTYLIQVSTQAVFGFGMEKEIKTTFLPYKRDFAYVETKLEMELKFKKLFPNNDLSIVRLGNVWGPGSGGWTAALANRLTFGQYVGVEGLDGFSNITDVFNIADYLIHLVNKRPKGQNIYHLAEFSNVKWSELIKKMAELFSVEPIYSDSKPSYPISLVKDIKTSLQLKSFGDNYRELMSGRIGASYLRSLVRLIGKQKFQNIKKKESRNLPTISKITNNDYVYLLVATSQVEFKPVLLDSWTPPLNFEKSWQRVTSWLQNAGYID